MYDGGPNGISLAEAQRRYLRYGCFYPEDSAHRAPQPDEPPDPAWVAATDPTADELHDFLRDLIYIFTVRAGLARDVVRAGGDERAHGRLDAWREVLRLVVSQADVFGIATVEVGLPGGTDPDRDFDGTPPTNRFAG